MWDQQQGGSAPEVVPDDSVRQGSQHSTASSGPQVPAGYAEEHSPIGLQATTRFQKKAAPKQTSVKDKQLKEGKGRWKHSSSLSSTPEKDTDSGSQGTYLTSREAPVRIRL